MSGAGGVTRDRLELSVEASRLRDKGMTARAIGQRLGISRSYASALCDDPDGAKERARKQRYAGTCERCGAKTSGCNGPGSALTVCISCAPAVYGPRYHADLLGKGKNIERLLAFLSEPRRWVEIRDHLGLSGPHTGVLLNRHLKTGLIVRHSRGVYSRAGAADCPPRRAA